ncbi:MAG: DUF2892 domain-containing protein [Glaciecola sp.]|jgi:hypothetical protein|nr:DUF2892 domain-containing protein [Glaciecola sp.]MDG1817058.1 DUF2892 domain-containing protein [Glaciecola sp.]MDG2099799.1 DUF2892 domain-containing protein [Glaciecola sp.]
MSSNKAFSAERALTAFAGLMTLLSVALTVWVHPNFVWLTVFVGANLFQQSYTGFCPAMIVLRKVFGFKTERELATHI